MNIELERYKLGLISKLLSLPTSLRAAFLEKVPEPHVRQELQQLDADISEHIPSALARLDDPLGLKNREDSVPGPGSRVGPWLLQDLLGEGGMSRVFLGIQEDTGISAAIKLAKPGLDRRLCLKKEWEILSSLSHPGIVGAIDYADSTHTPYLALSQVTGIPLNQCSKLQELPLQQRIELFVSVCEAVTYLHEHGIVHRDLKPANILITPEKQPVIIDFGAAGAPPTMRELACWNSTGMTNRMCTPDYAPPEQRDGAAPTFEADIWSLGLLLGYLLTGKRHEDGQTRGMFRGLLKKKKTPHFPMDSHDPLKAVVDKALQTDPEQRYRDVAQLIAACKETLCVCN